MNEKRASAIAQPEQEEASFPRSLSPGNGGTTWTDEQNRNLFQWNLDRNCRKLKKAELKSKQSVSRWSQVWKNQQRTLKLRRVISISEHPYSLQKHFNTLQTILNLRRVLKTLIRTFSDWQYFTFFTRDCVRFTRLVVKCCYAAPEISADWTYYFINSDIICTEMSFVLHVDSFLSQRSLNSRLNVGEIYLEHRLCKSRQQRFCIPHQSQTDKSLC